MGTDLGVSLFVTTTSSISRISTTTTTRAAKIATEILVLMFLISKQLYQQQHHNQLMFCRMHTTGRRATRWSSTCFFGGSDGVRVTSGALLLLSHQSSFLRSYMTVQAFSGRRSLYHTLSQPSSSALSSSSLSSSLTTATTTPNNNNNNKDSNGDMDGGFHTEMDFPDSVRVALAAVRKACMVAQNVQEQIQQPLTPSSSSSSSTPDQSSTKDGITQTKDDSTPVTVADYAAQAIILSNLQKAFSNGTLFLAEESSSGIRELKENDNGREMVRRIGQLAGFDSNIDSSDITSGQSDLERAIDIGQSYYLDRAERQRQLQQLQQQQQGQEAHLPPPDQFWCLDPIDGTKGFLRGGQYCVALALLEVGVPTIGILACPNLPPSLRSDVDGTHRDGTGGGCIFVACKGRGCYEVGMEESSYLHRLGSIPPDGDDEFANPSKARFSVGVEQGFSDPDGVTVAMGEYLHGFLEEGTGDILYCSRMDSQVKYGVIARGEAEFYVRLPRTHRDTIWDVAAGVLCLEEVGGKVTDLDGKPLDFTKGERLPTVGILGARTKQLHDALMEAFRAVSQKPEI